MSQPSNITTDITKPFDLRIAFIATYPPRRCGIGTFTKDLATAMNTLNPDRLAEIIAMDDPLSEELTYPWEVSHRIRQECWGDYEKVLDYLNNGVHDLVCIQHEFGIFGGENGAMILDFVRKLKKPYVVTFHSVMEQPRSAQKRIIHAIAKRAAAVVVMLHAAGETLARTYGVDPQKIVPIHHGAPDFPFFQDESAKTELGLDGRIVMSNVNLIGPGRGIEYAIAALPAVVKAYPKFLYLIIGQTHPVVKQHAGEVYRRKLEQLTRDLHLTKHVRFINEYVSLGDLVNYVRASDFYITPYEDMEIASSGSLAYAIAAGKLCLSTPYRYAVEMLAGGRGLLVEARNSTAIADAIIHALENEEDARRIREKCYMQGRRMIWGRVGFRYLNLFGRILPAVRTPAYLPPTLDYLDYLTGQYGIYEHAGSHGYKRREGYAVDDNARACIVAVQHNRPALAERYLDFLLDARHDGLMYCDRDHAGRWIGEPAMGDWAGRAFWAAAYTTLHGQTAALRRKAADLVRSLLPKADMAQDIRAQSYFLLGLVCLEKLEWDEFAGERRTLRDTIKAKFSSEFSAHSEANWRWPESALRYDNPRIPQAMLEAGLVWNDPEFQKLGLSLLDFVLDHTFDIRANHFRFIGNKGWLSKGQPRASFDEQPIEAGATVQACYAAWRVSGVNYYRQMADKAMAWFYGDNVMRQPLYDAERQSVRDGIGPQEISQNQGAEALLEYLLAYTCYAKLKDEEGQGSRDQTFALASEPAVAPAAAGNYLGSQRHSQPRRGGVR